MISGGDIGLDLIDLVQGLCQQRRRDLRCIDRPAADRQSFVGNHIGIVERVLVRLAAVAGSGVVDQPLIERPGVHLPLPLVHDLIAEAVGFGLLIGVPRGHPGGLGGGQVRRCWFSEQQPDLVAQRLCALQRIAVHCVRQVRVMYEH